VNILASIKLRRQVFVANHNPNAPVLGDVENAVVLRGVTEVSLRTSHDLSIISDVMKSRKDEPKPRTPPQDLPGIEQLIPTTTDMLVAGEPLEESLVRDVDLSGRKIPSLVVWNSVLDHVSLASSKIGKFRLRDVRLLKCDLSNSILQGFEATRVEFVDCRMTGLRAVECRWQDVLVENCDLRYAQLNGSQFRRSEFKSCNLAESDLRGTDLEGAVFTNAILHRADLSRAKLRGTDLRGAEIEGITVRPEDLSGAIVSVAQAIGLAKLLGVEIK
jgi:uncharacterized protein YjbI with pentapeptide repeats